jgi:hypothetical protein
VENKEGEEETDSLTREAERIMELRRMAWKLDEKQKAMLKMPLHTCKAATWTTPPVLLNSFWKAKTKTQSSTGD